ncbi:alpha/beta fold hydrolase [Actinomadura sp. 6N118]|uniref:alpha/beta fold hydrolase n=1 Tax=Actinomadura sp. 6N118 TaxID=3375151 RepID=UPI00379FF817
MDNALSQGLPVVFLHGIRISGTMWRPVMEIVGEHHPVLAPDMPGHGCRRGERFTMESALDVVAEAIDALGGRALVVGLSMGGYLGIATAGRHPERVAGLVAMGCTMRPRGLLGDAYRAAGWLASRDPERADRLSERVFRRVLPGAVGEAVVAGGLASEVMPQVIEAISASSPLRSLASYEGPVWLVNGERDAFRRHEREFLRACRDGRLTLLPRRGHVTTLVATDALARVVLDSAAVAGEPGRRGRIRPRALGTAATDRSIRP